MIVITVVHIVSCLLLVLVILIQSSKGEGLSSVMGGGPSTFFGTRAGNFLTKVTTGLAISFMLTSLVLAARSKRESGSVVGDEKGGVVEKMEDRGQGEEGETPAEKDEGKGPEKREEPGDSVDGDEGPVPSW